MPKTRIRLVAAAVPAVIALAGCGADATPTTTTTLTVFAAASLKTSFTTLGQQFEAAHRGTEVAFNFAGSADLVAQLQQGAPADVLASADTKNMDRAVADNLVSGTPVTFAANTLQIAVPPDNPAKINRFADLARPGVKLVVCAPAVPCGAAAEKIETATKINLTPVSEESAVTDVLNKVQTGEADAGLVYVTDVKAAGGRVQGVPFPEAAQAVSLYPIAALTGSKNAELATQFVELVTGVDGQQVLADAGFAGP